ncbi:MAG: hypothetical protein ACXWPP_12810 [Ktedonobacteraceae bacterium]
MSSATPSKSHPKQEERYTKVKTSRYRRIFQIFVFGILIIVVVVAWQLLNAYNNSTDPTIAGRPLSNPHTHLHSVVMGEKQGVLYLGTHYGLFTSTDGGHTWPQSHGSLSTYMVTSIAVSPSNPNILALIVIPTSGLGQQSGIAFSRDNGSYWQISTPSGLSTSAYPYSVKAGTGSSSQFYAYYFYEGWLETRDLGEHWYPITRGTLSGMQTPTLLTDSNNPNHLLLGEDQGLFESNDDGGHWLHISTIQGTVQSLIATNSTPRILYCATDQGFYHWHEGNARVIQDTHIPMTSPPTRLLVDNTGKALYGLSGQDLWFSSDEGNSWVHRWHFDRGDLISLVVDPMNSYILYAGFFLPPEVIYSKDGGNSWQTLTN